MSHRLSLHREQNSEWRIHVNFDAVTKAIELSRTHGRPSFILGENVKEEFVAYATGLGRYIDYHGTIIDRQGRHPFDALRSIYWGKTSTLRRVIGFANTHAPSIKTNISEDFLLSLTPSIRADVRGRFVNDYLAHKRDLGSNKEEIETFLRRFEQISIEGPIVITASENMLSYIQWLVISRWEEESPKTPLIILIDSKKNSIGPDSLSITRSPIKVPELVEFLGEKSPEKKRNVEKYFDLWRLSQPYRRNYTANSSITAYDSSAFASFLMRIDTEDDVVDNTIKSIPSKIIAPMMFARSENLIGIDHQPAKGLSPQAARGAARALRNQANDIILSGGLQNIAPGLNNVLSRISAAAERIEKSETAEESDVIEFGVEVSYFESRLFDAKDRLGEMSKGEVLAFSSEASRFLSRFDSWKNYIDETGFSTPSSEAADIASSLMRKAIDAGILTEDAVAKIEGTLKTGSDDNEGRQEGIARSSENLTSVVGRNALESIRSTTSDVGKEAKSQIAKSTIEASKNFIVANSPSLIRLAQLRGGRWLEMLTELFS